jgi:hypothetical protein
LRSDRDEYAASGDKIHAALRDGSDAGLSLVERDTFNACQSIEQKVVTQFFGAGVETWKARERRFWITFDELRHSGQVDLVHRCGLRALIIDYKSLMGDTQESPKNLQLRDLAVLARENLIVDTVGVCIIQPFVTHSPDLCLYDRQSLILARGQMCERINHSNAMGAKRTPSEVACKFCLAAKLGKCVEYQQWAGQIAPPAIMAALDVPIAQWSPETRARAMDAVKQAYKLLENIEQNVREGLAQDPAFCPGWELAPGRNMETITEPETVFQRFISLGGKSENFMRCVKIIKGNLAVALANVNAETGKRLSGALAELIKGCTEKTVSAPILRRKDTDEIHS